jgi:CheY-like chemotaxis protein
MINEINGRERWQVPEHWMSCGITHQSLGQNFQARMNTSTFNQPPRRWLLVDDDFATLRVLERLLRRLTNAAIECHHSAETALAAFAAQPEAYELVITDFQMPDLNGVELCRQLRQVSVGPKIFLATGSGCFSEESARAAGFDALLDKPFALTDLQAALANAGLATAHSCLA